MPHSTTSRTVWASSAGRTLGRLDGRATPVAPRRSRVGAAARPAAAACGWFDSSLDLQCGLRVVEFGPPQDIAIPPARGAAGASRALGGADDR